LHLASHRSLGFEKHWYAFRTGALREIAVQWGAKKGIEWKK
jgi:hypothetical protein